MKKFLVYSNVLFFFTCYTLSAYDQAPVSLRQHLSNVVQQVNSITKENSNGNEKPYPSSLVVSLLCIIGAAQEYVGRIKGNPDIYLFNIKNQYIQIKKDGLRTLLHIHYHQMIEEHHLKTLHKILSGAREMPYEGAPQSKL